MEITKYNQREQSKHRHEFELRNKMYKQFTCDGCKEPGLGSRYRCEQCDYDLHEECYLHKERKSPKSTIALGSFKCSEFQFFRNPQTERGNGQCKEPARACYACGNDIDGFYIHCNNGYDLHPCCAHLKNEYSMSGISCKLSQKVESKACKWCNKNKLSGTESKIRGLWYVSDCKKYRYHVYCVIESKREAWKKGDSGRVVEKIDLRGTRRSNRDRGGRGNDVWKAVKISLKTIALVSKCVL